MLLGGSKPLDTSEEGGHRQTSIQHRRSQPLPGGAVLANLISQEQRALQGQGGLTTTGPLAP